MYGEWLRVTPADLERAKGDLAWLQDRAQEISEAEHDEGRDIGQRRSFGSDKTWHALDYLLDRHGFPVSIVFGEEAFLDDPEEPPAGWDYGPPRYLTPERVQAAASALAVLTGEDLIAGVDQADLHRDGVYPSIWDRPGELPWAVCHVPDVKLYFEAAATAGDAVVCWIS
jgi:hypothetical protein